MPPAPTLAWGAILALGLHQAEARKMLFWLDILGSVHSSEANAANHKVLVTGLKEGPDGIAVDPAERKVYWSNMDEGKPTGSLQRANLDGTGVEYVVAKGGTHTPKQIQLDLKHRKVYWSDRDGYKIQRSNLDGTQNEVLVSGLQNPVGMALDVEAGVFYWSDRNAGTIARAAYALPAGQTAANRKDIDTLFSGLSRPIDLALDLAAGKIYWTDRDDNVVYRANLGIPSGKTHRNRTDKETLVTGLSTPIGMSLDLAAGKLYYTDQPGRVGQANLDGSGKVVLYRSPTGGVYTGITFVEIPDATAIGISPLRQAREGDVSETGFNALGIRMPGQALQALRLPIFIYSR